MYHLTEERCKHTVTMFSQAITPVVGIDYILGSLELHDAKGVTHIDCIVFGVTEIISEIKMRKDFRVLVEFLNPESTGYKSTRTQKLCRYTLQGSETIKTYIPLMTFEADRY